MADDRVITDRLPAQELGALLRSRREGLTPADVGLPDGERRRAPGLRREEVCRLAGISPTYLAFLEQGRDVHPSREVLLALAGALRLTDAERDYLLALAGAPAVPPPTPPVEAVSPALRAFVDRLDPHPAYVTGRAFDVLHANRAAELLWTPWTGRAAGDRNLLRWMLLDPAARTLYLDWEAETSAQLARFRQAAARHPGDPAFARLAQELVTASPEAAAWWERHEVAGLTPGRKRLFHAELGELDLDYVVLQAGDAPEQKLVAFTAPPADAARLRERLGASA